MGRIWSGRVTESGELEYPYYFTIMDDGHIFAADCSSARVLLLNSDFAGGRLLPTDGHAASSFKKIDYIQGKQQLLAHGIREIAPGVYAPVFVRYFSQSVRQFRFLQQILKSHKTYVKESDHHHHHQLNVFLGGRIDY